MLGVLGLLTGWVLLGPLLVLLYLRIGGAPQAWMALFLGIASSVPMLGLSSVGGVALIALSVRKLARARDEDLAPPR